MSMIEQVARAIATADARSTIDDYKERDRWNDAQKHYDLINNNGRFYYDELARTAIKALREPTIAVQKVCVDALVSRDDWEAIIDAALEEDAP